MSSTGAPRAGSLLGVWAHPDDEAYLSAGLMAIARDAGERVVVATATRGEHGTDRPDLWPPQLLGQLREHELAASLAAVGVTEHRWLGHVDGTLADVALSAGAEQVRRLLDEVQPETVVTFGPDGMTGHSDHRAVSAWVTRAWYDAGGPGQLWYPTLTPQFHQAWDELHDRIGLWEIQPDPPTTEEDDLAAVVVCDQVVLARKYAALRAHASQTAGLEALMGERYRDWWATEFFVSADRVPDRSFTSVR